MLTSQGGDKFQRALTHRMHFDLQTPPRELPLPWLATRLQTPIVHLQSPSFSRDASNMPPTPHRVCIKVRIRIVKGCVDLVSVTVLLPGGEAPHLAPSP